MVTTLVAVYLALVGASYLLVAMTTARRVYGKARATRIDLYRDRHDPEPIERFDRWDRAWFLGYGLFCGLIWPVTWVVAVLIWAGQLLVKFMDRTPWRSGFEMELDEHVRKFEEIKDGKK